MKIFVLTALLFILVCSGAFAEGTATATATSSQAEIMNSTETTVSGTVESVDADAMKLSVKDAQENAREFTLKPDCKIRKGRHFVNLSEVVAGDEVTMICTGQPNRSEAKSIHVHPKQKVPAPAGPEVKPSEPGGKK
jgi:hypothetical protein